MRSREERACLCARLRARGSRGSGVAGHRRCRGTDTKRTPPAAETRPSRKGYLGRASALMNLRMPECQEVLHRRRTAMQRRRAHSAHHRRCFLNPASRKTAAVKNYYQKPTEHIVLVSQTIRSSQTMERPLQTCNQTLASRSKTKNST